MLITTGEFHRRPGREYCCLQPDWEAAFPQPSADLPTVPAAREMNPPVTPRQPRLCQQDYNINMYTRLTTLGTTQVSRYQKCKTNLDFTEASDSDWQWHQLSHMQVCTSLQTDNHSSTPPLSFLKAGCPSCRPVYSVKALKAQIITLTITYSFNHNCETAGVHENKTVCRPSNIKVNKHHTTI